jgi:hypothetical protein
MLPKRGMQRLLNSPSLLAGANHPNEAPTSQVLVPCKSGGMCDLDKNLPARVDPVTCHHDAFIFYPPASGAALEQRADGTVVALRAVDCHSRRRQPETGAGLQEKDIHGRVPYVTPGEVMQNVSQIDWILNGQATMKHPEAWILQQVEHIIWMWTAPYDSL